MNDQQFHNKIAQLVCDKFNSLPKSGKPKDDEWTILSGIVLEEASQFEVVALGTGSKCIGHDKLSKDGDILNDSHAEVMCRRAFLRYVYESILSQTNTFTLDPKTQSFQIGNSTKFHFFTSHVPCGDAAIFPKEVVEDVGNSLSDTIAQKPLKRSSIEPNASQKRIKLDNDGDIFRTGAKCLKSAPCQDLHLDGDKYHVPGVVRTKPGRGCLTLSVSCSDKLAKWCHLGVQGALLSVLLSKPIYLNSFTIAGGTPFCEEALRRALYTRLGQVALEPPHYRNEMILGRSDSAFNAGKSDGKNPCPASIAWFKSDDKQQRITEVAVDGRRQGITKKQMKTSGALKICKRGLMKCFIDVVEKFHINALDNSEDIHKLTYKEAKMLGKNYQKAWNSLKCNFSAWTVKDEDLLQFTV